MTYELFSQGPGVYIPVILLSLLFTVIGYGVFPMVLAKTRKKQITRKKYNTLCYVVNFVVWILFFLLEGGSSTTVPYMLWTWVFSSIGAKKLLSRRLLEGEEEEPEDLNRIVRCTSCGYQSRAYFESCPKCGRYAKEYVSGIEMDGPINLRFCNACGEMLPADASFCGKCGIRVDVPLCRNCGAPLLPNGRFCGKCGSPVQSGENIIEM